MATPNVLYPYIQHLPKILIRHRQYFHYQLTSNNVLITIWSAIGWLCLVMNLTIGCINYIFHKVKNQITWKCFTMIPTNCLCWKIPLCAYWAKKGNMIISKEIIFNQPWFHCYFLLNKHTASCNFITQRCSHFSLLLLPLCSLNPKFTFTLPLSPSTWWPHPSHTWPLLRFHVGATARLHTRRRAPWICCTVLLFSSPTHTLCHQHLQILGNCNKK